jgi:integrase
VQLPAFVTDVLKVYKHRWSFKHGTAENPWVRDHRIVFLTPGTSFPFQEANVGRQLKAACLQAGIPVVPPYGLLHSFASYLLAKNIQTKIVSDMMGHTSTKMTERYQHTTRDLQQQAVDAWGTRTVTV